MIKKLILLSLAGLMLAAPAQASVTDDVRKTVNEVIRIVSDKEMKKPSQEQKRRAAIKQAIGTVFDQQEMARRSLGKHWNQRTPDERRQFVELFSGLLENSYADKIESYNNERIVYVKEVVDGDFAEVKSKVITAKNEEYTLDYRALKQSSGKWVVYDVVIEGVSLVSNYRTQFNKIISANGYAELVKKLQSKSNELKAR
ncbi:MlaC/ttg2D family ABC transporter substrate-binding protein [Trichlorobacter ammonificans]|uniref:Phospholipid transport system substrate-binding protein n=1 Tax=Trichlorobacter ammonificans TaxID=2916410 RepID=A0ABM9DBA7_9BACT|nr:ABC transporter substrate-binding protein [Trichlorobacter ammonificans]CAH2032481.1 Phospholipid transport system substrate-binding protein [Trichlorobacter ammonificans]